MVNLKINKYEKPTVEQWNALVDLAEKNTKALKFNRIVTIINIIMSVIMFVITMRSV